MKKLFLIAFLSVFAWAKPVVTTSILPLKYFVEQIAGDSVEVGVMVGEGANPHSYEPKVAQMKILEKSKIFFAIGIEYEKAWLPKFSAQFPNLKVVQVQDGIKLMAMKAHSHEHEHEHEHEHGGLDPHIWLDPIIVKDIAKNITSALSAEFPQNKELYNSNLNKFESDLDALDAKIKSELSNLKSRKFIVYHPSWGYFAARYGLEQIPVEIEGKEPKPSALAHLIEEAKEEGAKVIFVSPQFSTKSAELIAKESGAKVVKINHLSYDWQKEMLSSVAAFKDALQ